MQRKKMLTKKNIGNVVFILLFLVVILVPSAKALVLQGLMEIGLFKPSIDKPKNLLVADLHSIKFKDSKNKIVSLATLKGKLFS